MGFWIIIADILEKEQAEATITTCRQKGARVLYIRVDISQAADRQRIIDAAEDFSGRIDLLVNNAGVAPRVRTDILEATEESYDYVMNINLKGPYFLTQMIARHMMTLKKAEPDCTPMIINIGSLSTYTSSPSRGEYCLSKAGVGMMTKLYADRLAEYGILVYEIRPGIIRTDMTAGVKQKYDNLIEEGITPLKRWGEPADIAAAVHALAAGAFPFSTGMVINVDGGFHLRRL